MELLACTEEEYQIPAGEPVREKKKTTLLFSINMNQLGVSQISVRRSTKTGLYSLDVPRQPTVSTLFV